MRNAFIVLAAIPIFIDLGGCLPAPAGAAPGGEEVSDCGLVPELIPDFSLQDVNPNSATYKQTVNRDDLMGDVMFLYWAQAT